MRRLTRGYTGRPLLHHEAPAPLQARCSHPGHRRRRHGKTPQTSPASTPTPNHPHTVPRTAGAPHLAREQCAPLHHVSTVLLAPLRVGARVDKVRLGCSRGRHWRLQAGPAPIHARQDSHHICVHTTWETRQIHNHGSRITTYTLTPSSPRARTNRAPQGEHGAVREARRVRVLPQVQHVIVQPAGDPLCAVACVHNRQGSEVQHAT